MNDVPETLIGKLATMPLEELAEVETFVDVLRRRSPDRRFVADAMVASEAAFARVWDNPDDAAYDAL